MTGKDIHDYQLPGKIKRIEKDQGGFIRECCIELLVCWMGREGRSATVEKVAEALEKAELKNVANELKCMDTTQVRLL